MNHDLPAQPLPLKCIGTVDHTLRSNPRQILHRGTS